MAFSKIHTIHCYGDSLTAGYGADPRDGWIPRLAQDFRALTFYNHGILGASLFDILDDAWTIVHYPSPGEALFVMGGTNDILSGIALPALIKKSEAEIRTLSAKIPMILGIPPLTTKASIAAGWQADWAYERNNEDLTLFGDFLRRLSQSLAIPAIDFQKQFPREEAFYSDGVHPNAKGYAAFETIAKADLARLF